MVGRIVYLDRLSEGESEGESEGDGKGEIWNTARSQALASELAYARGARERQADQLRNKRALANLRRHYGIRRDALLAEQASLYRHPKFRNWETNPIRRERYEERRQELRTAVTQLAADYRQRERQLQEALKNSRR
jgi:hypothetical protein